LASDPSALLLETPRLRLRELADDDFDAVHAYASDPEVVRYMPWGPNTEEETRGFLWRAQATAGGEPRLAYELAVVVREDDRLIGAVGLHLAPEEDRAMLGYCYDRGSWGHGYATEAAAAMLSLGFDVLLLHRVWAGCDPENLASARVLEKVGMRLEGRLRDDVRIRGEYRDTLVYGLLEDEWRERDAGQIWSPARLEEAGT
jgi:RimJ/RimL family protein N-acetyltransferase